jgi:hypothetical protein
MAIGSPASSLVAAATTTMKKAASTSARMATMTTTATTTATATTTMTTNPASPQQHYPRAAIVGGSLGGLAAANALLSAGWKHVDVYERAPGPLHDKGSGLGYVNVPAWEALRQRRRRPHDNHNRNHNAPMMMMRRGQRASRHQGSFFYGDLWKYLYEGLPENTVKLEEQWNH